MKLNGVTLGAGSPYLTVAGARRKLAGTELDMRIAFMELLVGKVPKGGERVPGAGLTGRIPDLGLIYAIESSNAPSKAAAARRKGAGQLKHMPDHHWPVARGPFIGLYLEAKREGGKARPGQRALHERLRAAGHAVVVFDSAQAGLDIVLRYESLGERWSDPEMVERGDVERFVLTGERWQ